MNFWNRAAKATKSAADKASHILEINRLKSKKYIEEKSIKEFTQKIGDYYVAQMDRGLEIPGELNDDYQKIIECRYRIHALQVNIEQLKKQNPSSQIRCTFCGAFNCAEEKFCAQCGNQLEPERDI